MKRLLLALILLVSGVAIGVGGARPAQASFIQNNIIDDTKFDNVNTMSAADIQNFLNQFPGSCLRSYTDLDPQDYFTYGPGTTSAANIIYKAAQFWGINPQVILTTLEKEESLVTGGVGCAGWRYNSAMGYGCPDSGGCNPAYAGFSKQVVKGSWQLRFSEQRSYGNLAWDGDSSVYYSGFMTQGTRARVQGGSAVYYDGWATIDGVAVHMDNGPTASLYTYTPHFHGNQVFTSLYENWFGTTHGDQYTWAHTAQVAGNSTIYLVDGSTAYPIPDPETFNAYGFTWGSQRQLDQTTFNSDYTVGQTLTTWVTGVSGGAIYIVDQGQKKSFPDFTTYTAWGANAGNRVITLSDAFISAISSGSTVTTLARTPDGSVYFITSNTKRPFPDMTTFNSLGYSWSNVVNYSSYTVNQVPDGTLMLRSFVGIIPPGEQSVYLTDGGSRWPVTGDGFAAWGLSWGNVYHVDQLTAQSYTATGSALPTLIKDSGGQGYLVVGGEKRPIPGSWGLSGGTYPTSPSDALIGTLPTGSPATQLLRDPSGSVYYITGGHTRPIGNPSIFSLAGFSWGQVINVPSSVVALIPAGGLLLPDGLIVNPTGSSSYYLMDQGQKFAIPSPAVFNAWGFDWNAAYHPDQASLDAYPASASPLSYFATDLSHSNVFTMNGGGKWFFPNDATFLAYGVSGNLSVIDRWIIDGRPTGGILTRFIQGSGYTVYYMKNSQKQPIPDPATLFALGGSWGAITHLSDSVVSQFPTGPTASSP